MNELNENFFFSSEEEKQKQIKQLPIHEQLKSLNISDCEQLLESSQEPVIIIDPFERIIFYNRAAAHLWGYAKEEALGSSVSALVQSDWEDKEKGFIVNYLSPKENFSEGKEAEAVLKRGGYVPIRIKMVETQQDGKPALAIFAKNISREKQLMSEKEEYKEELQQNLEQLEEVHQSYQQKIADYEQQIKQIRAENQHQIEELQATEEELRQNMEELTSTQEQLRMRDIELTGQMNAINNSFAFVEFDTQGYILKANDLFLNMMGYTLDEVKNTHHRIFVDSVYAQSETYRQFWIDLRAGKHISGTFKRLTKKGEDVWISGSYTPVFDEKGQVSRIIKIAINVTQERLRNNDVQSQLEAINRTNAVIEFDLEGNLKKVNPIFTEIFKYEAHEIEGKHHSLLVTEEEKYSTEYRQFWLKLRKGEALNGEFKRIDKNGNTVWIQGTYIPILDLNGLPYKIVKYAKDITKQKELEQAIQEQLAKAQASEEELRQNLEELEATQDNLRQTMEKMFEAQEQLKVSERLVAETAKRFESVLENCNDAVVTSDQYGKIEFFNKAAEALWGYSKEEIIGKNVRMLMPEGHSRNHDTYMSNYLQTHQAKVIGIGRRLEAITKSGEIVPIHLTITEAKMGENSLFTAFIRDIRADVENENKRKKAEESVIKTIKRYERILEGCYDAVVSANANGVIEFFNKAAEQLWGYNRDEVLGKKIDILMPAIHARRHDTYMQNYMQTGVAKIIGIGREVEALTKAGDTVPILLTIAESQEDNKPTFTAFIKDITKEVELRNQRDATEKTLRENLEMLGATQVKLQEREQEMTALLAAINSAFAFVEIDADCRILNANKIFLDLMGYNLEEVKGKHHQIFVDKAHAESEEYKNHWKKVLAGNSQLGNFKRRTKDGKEVWLNATYTPITNEKGEVVKVIKLANDITDFTLSLQAVSKFLNQLKNGNFDTRFEIDESKAQGEIAKMVKDNIELRNTLQSIVKEINRVVDLAGREGILGERLKLAGIEGSWKALVDSINLLLESIFQPIMEINKVVLGLSMGDLTQKTDIKAQGDIADMINALGIAIKNLNELLKNIEISAKYVAQASDNMLRKAEGMKVNTTEVVTAIQQMADGAQEQAARTDESSRLVENILKSSNEMASKASIIDRAAEMGQKSCEEGLKIIKSVVENMNEIAKSANFTSTSIATLSNRSEEISRTLNVITEIAFQTNLLALNASIEAARAGDAGRGFQVVAEEIKKLAEDSRRSATEIEKVIRDVQKDVALSNKAIEKMQVNVENGNKATLEAQNVFDEINKNSTQNLALSKEILLATQEQKEAISVVVKNIEKIVVVSEQTATGTQEIASSSIQLNNTVGDVTATSKDLANIAQQLKEGVSKFKLN